MRRLLPVLGVVAVLAAGCGSSSSTTPEQFAARLKATCAEFSKRAKSIHIQAPGVDPTAPSASPLLVAQFARTIQQVSTLFGEELDRLRQLDPPAAQAARWHTFLRLYAQTEAVLTRGGREARRGNKEGIVSAFSALDGLSAKIDATGFKCG